MSSWWSKNYEVWLTYLEYENERVLNLRVDISSIVIFLTISCKVDNLTQFFDSEVPLAFTNSALYSTWDFDRTLKVIDLDNARYLLIAEPARFDHLAIKAHISFRNLTSCGESFLSCQSGSAWTCDYLCHSGRNGVVSIRHDLTIRGSQLLFSLSSAIGLIRSRHLLFLTCLGSCNWLLTALLFLLARVVLWLLHHLIITVDGD